MCWNAPVSLLTFLSSAAMCAYLWHRNNNNDRALSIFIFWFALMQLLEFFMWRNMHDHSFIAKLSLLALQLQPFILVASLYYYSIKTKSIKYSTVEKGILLSVGLLSLIKAISSAYYAFITTTKTKWLSVKGPHCHLMWWFSVNSNKLPFLAHVDKLWIFLLLVALLMIRPLTQGLFYTLFAVIGCALTYIYYPGEMGSLWCWIANLMGIFAITMPYVTKKIL
jgi:hypothetical protein